jgi:hypothetical protein
MNPENLMNVDAVQALIRIAGQREDPPAGAYDRVWPAAEATWLKSLRRRRTRRAAGWLAAAAAVVVAGVTAVIWLRPTAQPVTEVARLDRTVGSLEIHAASGGAWLPVDVGLSDGLAPGTRLRTGVDGRAGLLLGGEVSVRLAESSEIELADERKVRLVRGVVYPDTGPGGRGGQVQVITAGGTLQDFGTQFEVSYDDSGLRLRVREGQVVMARDAQRLVAHAEQQIAVDGQGRISRDVLSRSDPAWHWVESVAPSATTDGQPVTALLQWVSRETGRELRYADRAIEQEAAATILHGQLSGLAPLKTLEVMLATTDLAYKISDDEAIEVLRRPD